MKRWFYSLLMLGALMSPGPAEAPPGPPPDQVLAELKAGHARFLSGTPTRQHESKGWREKVSSAQHPKAVILGCADSRVPPELLFDQGFGDLFVIRIAGNVVEPEVAGSLEYAFEHTGSRLVVVMGHEDCGAVTAALNDYTREDLAIQLLLKHIVPALHGLPADLPQAERVQAGVYANVRQSVRELKSLPACAKAIAGGQLSIVGAVYNLHTGIIDWLDEQPVPSSPTRKEP